MPRARRVPAKAPEHPVAPDQPTPESLPADAEPAVSADEPDDVAEAETQTEEESEVDAPVRVSHDEGRDLPFADGEEIVAQAVRDNADLIIVTNFGRKVRIDPDGNYEVVTGPPFEQEVPAIPKPPRATWHD